ncbi:multidrug resistance efflux transporter family protein [Halobacillus litoralis]|uniref:DMT family transporter n=1 Tax=Halobacillus litoralis TaxID=45668 RepID=UPI001CD5ACBC|nr:multidrug resistance efflux transporter family protein [Halobacillus litoralis]MCA0970861.1 multidrug resistance efflux transporter family protein [Halobacillus litoralis]
MKEIALGVLSSMFFAVTFVLNRSMELDGGSWMWSASLRFLFMVPFLILIVWFRKNVRQVFIELKKDPLPWLAWSFVGFVLFYAPLTYAAAYGPGWLVSGTWQFTIVAGLLLPPLFKENQQTGRGVVTTRKKIQKKSLAISLIILTGVLLIQQQKAGELTLLEIIIGVGPVVIAAFAYPLGNRKMMEVCSGKLDTFQRILGMTLASLPFWVILSGAAFIDDGLPSASQTVQSLIVAVCSGVIATTLFFIATNRVKDNQGKLGAVEATQSMQVLFVIAGEAYLLSSPLPSGIAVAGVSCIIIGIIVHTFHVKKIAAAPALKQSG